MAAPWVISLRQCRQGRPPTTCQACSNAFSRSSFRERLAQGVFRLAQAPQPGAHALGWVGSRKRVNQLIVWGQLFCYT